MSNVTRLRPRGTDPRLLGALIQLEAQIDGIVTAAEKFTDDEIVTELQAIENGVGGSPWLAWSPATIMHAILEAERANRRFGRPA